MNELTVCDVSLFAGEVLSFVGRGARYFYEDFYDAGTLLAQGVSCSLL